VALLESKRSLAARIGRNPQGRNSKRNNSTFVIRRKKGVRKKNPRLAAPQAKEKTGRGKEKSTN